MNTFTDWIIAYMAVISAGLTFGLLVTAWWAASAARDTLAQMRDDSAAQREDSARATRPYVHARIVPSLGGTDAWDLIVENTGRTAAFKLSMSISQAEEKAEPEDIVTATVRNFAEAEHTLHPGASVRMFWVVGATETDPTGFPPSMVALHYEDGEGLRYDERPYLLDPGKVGATPVPYTGAVRNEDNDESIPRNTLNTLRAIAHHLGEGNR